MFVILIVAVVVIAAVGLIVPLVDPQGKSVLTRAVVAVGVDSRVKAQSLPLPARVGRWTILAACLVAAVVLVANLGTIVDWLAGSSLFEESS